MPCSHFLRKMPARAATVSDTDLRFPELHVTCGEELSVRSKVSALCAGSVLSVLSGCPSAPAPT